MAGETMTTSVSQINSSFSTSIPNLQIAWDSTSMGTLMECPRKYQYSIINGWQPREMSVHLTFGLLYHAALELYDRCKFNGQDHEESIRSAVRYALTETWNSELKRGWISDHNIKNRLTLVRSIVWYLETFQDDPSPQYLSQMASPLSSYRFDLRLTIPPLTEASSLSVDIWTGWLILPVTPGSLIARRPPTPSTRVTSRNSPPTTK
jgi:hypothetical protein